MFRDYSSHPRLSHNRVKVVHDVGFAWIDRDFDIVDVSHAGGDQGSR